MSNNVIRQQRDRNHEEEIPASSMTGRISKSDMGSNYKSSPAPAQLNKPPRKEPESEPVDDQLYELFVTKIRSYLPDSSHEVIQSASEVASEQLSNRDISVPEKRKELEELLNASISDDDLHELINLSNSIESAKQNHQQGNGDDEFVAIDFNSSDDEEQAIEAEIEVEDESDKETDTEEPTSNEHPKAYDWHWLQQISEFKHYGSQVFDLLADKDLDLLQLDSKLNELLDSKGMDFIVKCIEHRWRIVFSKRLQTENKEPVIKEMEELGLHSLINELHRKRLLDDETSNPLKRQKKVKRVPQKISLDRIVFSTSVENARVTLPEGTTHEVKKSYDTITVPAPAQSLSDNDELLPISTLPDWAEEAFPKTETTTFNRIQSKIYNQAFETDNNLLICAPTGAGKTNVAMLTILRTIENFRNNGHIQLKNFKIVYIAPLKALVQEQMREFQRRLTSVYGVVVNELTGDLSLSKQQIAETQIIVTTPEKWDIITRKDPSYVKLVKLMIIDEIHLLHDERGPVLESLVSRAIRKSETTGSDIRIVGLSATLPNYADVAKFIRAKPEGLFYFDASYRPCPLEQVYIGVKEQKAIKRIAAMNEACYDRMHQSLQDRHQLIIFVHSRKETFTTAKYLMEKLDIDIVEQEGVKEILKQEGESMSNPKLKEVIPRGFGIHHAGLTKKDRGVVEDLFAQGHLRVLVSTATLAWGVNLPAHTVIIKGTETYSPESGAWVQLSPQDILQMLGRAGRPRYDKNGEGIIITSQDEVQYYLAILNQQLPIESQLIHKLVDNINAEIVAGSITTIEEGIEWLTYTYFFVRMLQSPALYGVEATYDFTNDPTLYNRRADLIYTAFCILHENKLVVYNAALGSVASTELGKIASHFYINFETINLYGKMLKPWHSETDILSVFSNSGEFKYVPVRQEERLEISKLMEKCPIPIKEQPNEPLAKINILLQTFISRLSLEGYALIADMIYITQSAGRLLRALYEIALLQKWSSLAKSILNLCKMVDKRLWLNNSPLRQFGDVVPHQIIRASEMSHLPWIRYFHLNPDELAVALNLKGNAQIAKQYIDSFPKVSIQYMVQPITEQFLRIQVEVIPEWSWILAIHGSQEIFNVFLEGCDGNKLLHSEQFIVKRKNINKPHILEFFVSFVAPPLPNYILSFVSEKWVHCTWKSSILLSDVISPKVSPHYLDNNVDLVPTETVGDLFPFTHFNKLQSSTFDTVYNSENNVFIGSSKGDGKTVLAELAILNHWNNKKGRIVYINPCQELVDKLFKKWSTFFLSYEKEINVLSGNLREDSASVNQSHLILATPEQFNCLSKRWKTRKAFRSIDLFIWDDLHLVGSDVHYEMLVTRVRMLTSQWDDYKLRIVALSSPVLNSRDIAEWIGVAKLEMFNFAPHSRENRITEIKLSVESSDNTVKIYKDLAKVNSGLRNTLIFAPSYIHAFEMAHSMVENNQAQEWRSVDLLKLEKYILKIQNPLLKNLLPKGIAVFYSGMARVDRLIVERLFESKSIGVLFCTMDTSKFAPTANNVFVAGTRVYDGHEHRFLDYPLNDLYEMVGCCQDGGVVHIYTTSQMVEFYSSFLNLGLAVESLLSNSLHEFFMDAVANGIIKQRQNCIDVLTFTFFYRRLLKNPSFYDLKEVSNSGISTYLSELIESVFDDFNKEEFIEEEDEGDTISPLNKIVIASHYNSTFETVSNLSKLSNKSKLKDIFHALTNATEFSDLPVREGEDALLIKLQTKLPIKYSQDDYESPFFKAFILLQAHISRISIPFDLRQDQKSVLTRVLQILNAAIDILSSDGSLNVLLAMDLSQMIVQAVWSSDNPLRQVPRFTNEILARCTQHNVETVYDIMSLEDEERNEILQLPDQELNEVASFVNLYPNIELLYEMKGGVTSNESKFVTVTIDRDEEIESLEVVKNENFPVTKQENWWIVVGDSKTRHLYGIKKVNIQKISQSFEIEFTIPNKGKHELTIYLICDSYLDADKEMEFVIDVV